MEANEYINKVNTRNQTFTWTNPNTNEIFNAEIIIEQLTSLKELDISCSVTANKTLNVNWNKLLHCEHSPIRTIFYRVSMKNIPAYVSVHFTRHKVGVEHFVTSLRNDKSYTTGEEDRWSPVNHVMYPNAQAVLTMSRRRLCGQASKETQLVMKNIKKCMQQLDPIIAKHMFPMCKYRGNICFEIKSCGVAKHWKDVEIQKEENQ
jgi:hypothetical protein